MPCVKYMPSLAAATFKLSFEIVLGEPTACMNRSKKGNNCPRASPCINATRSGRPAVRRSFNFCATS